jgi:hypothetical protein
MRTDDLDRFCGQNADCPRHGQRAAGNLSICGHFGKPHHRLLYCNGCGVRQTARLVGGDKDTVRRLALLAGRHAKAAHDELVAYSPRHP